MHEYALLQGEKFEGLKGELEVVPCVPMYVERVVEGTSVVEEHIVVFVFRVGGRSGVAAGDDKLVCVGVGVLLDTERHGLCGGRCVWWLGWQKERSRGVHLHTRPYVRFYGGEMSDVIDMLLSCLFSWISLVTFGALLIRFFSFFFA